MGAHALERAAADSARRGRRRHVLPAHARRDERLGRGRPHGVRVGRRGVQRSPERTCARGRREAFRQRASRPRLQLAAPQACQVRCARAVRAGARVRAAAGGNGAHARTHRARATSRTGARARTRARGRRHGACCEHSRRACARLGPAALTRPSGATHDRARALPRANLALSPLPFPPSPFLRGTTPPHRPSQARPAPPARPLALPRPPPGAAAQRRPSAVPGQGLRLGVHPCFQFILTSFSAGSRVLECLRYILQTLSMWARAEGACVAGRHTARPARGACARLWMCARPRAWRWVPWRAPARSASAPQAARAAAAAAARARPRAPLRARTTRPPTRGR